MASSWPNVFSVDVEEYFQVSAFERRFPREQWDSIPSRLDRGLDAVLEIAGGARVRGTFFVLGWIARRHPAAVRRIVAAGHEIGCHGADHGLLYRMDRASFRDDLRSALRAVEDASGARCRVYRAPSFSVTRRSLWALRILAEEGIRIDSSVFPVVHDRYGIPGAPRFPFRPLRDAPDFVEFPPSTVRIAGLTLPCAGGGYFRLLPLWVTRKAVRRIRERDGWPALLYLHPWEFDPGQPVVPAPRLTTFRHRVNLGRTSERLAELFRRFEFDTMSRVVEAMGGAGALPVAELGSGGS